MANWSGTVTYNNPTGTLTSADATHANDTGANWPTGGGGLTGIFIRITSGPGASTTPVIIATNTSTQITVAAWPAGTPNNTSTYEIVFILKNGDHITGSLTFGANSINELEDSATIYMNGAYNLKANSTTCVMRWNKTPSTMVTFCANNRTTAGIMGFWGYLWMSAAFVTPPAISYIKLLDTYYGLMLDANCDLSNVHHIWVEGIIADTGFNGGAMTADQKYKNCYIKGQAFSLIFNSTGAQTATYDTCWTDGLIGALWNATGPTTQKVRNCVIKGGSAVSYINNAAGQTYSIEDSYITPQLFNQRLVGCASAAAAGVYKLLRNTITSGRSIYSAANSSATCTSNFNDIAPQNVLSSTYPYTDCVANPFTALTSDNDYISGMLGAIPQNVDTTQGMTTSNSTPAQYKNLTANRTNAKAVRNFPLVMDNVVIGSITQNSAVITFDCQNGAVAGQGSTTVDANSASGQPVLNVADTTGFSVGETACIGFGTARAESFEILSIDVGVSITGTTNLAFTHAAADADTVKKSLRHIALPFVEYGTTSGRYTAKSDYPDESLWGPLYCGIITTFNGITYEWKKYGHSIALTNLKPQTKYYIVARGTTPIGDKMSSIEYDFTTLAIQQSTIHI